MIIEDNIRQEGQRKKTQNSRGQQKGKTGQ
jgi:hypothetical protein